MKTLKLASLLGFLLIGTCLELRAGNAEGLLAVQRGDFQKAFAEFVEAANRGDAEAAKNIGWMYQFGRGVPESPSEASKWYQLAANAGNAVAQNNLGHMLRLGLGIPRDVIEARRWFEKSSGQNHPEAKANLGLIYCNGEGVRQNFEVCAKLTLEAANAGIAQSQFMMAVLHMGGFGVTKDESEAKRWAERAAAQGHGEALTWTRIWQSESQGKSQSLGPIDSKPAR